MSAAMGTASQQAARPARDPEMVRAERLAMIANGFAPVPLLTGAKHTERRDWPEQAKAMLLPGAALPVVEPRYLHTGLACAGLRGVDIDIDDPAIAARVRDLAEQILGETIVRRRWDSPRVFLPYRAAEGEPRKISIIGPGGKVEVLGAGQQAFIYGVHPDGAELEWEPLGPADIPRDALPAVTDEQIREFLTAAALLIGALPPGAARGNGSTGKREAAALAPPDAAAVVDLFGRLPNPLDFDYDQYVAVMLGAAGCIQGLAARNQLGDDDAASIGEAAVAWAVRWEGGGRGEAYERSKWADDWSKRDDPKAGWPSLQLVAATLIPGYRPSLPVGGAFDGVNLPPAPPLTPPPRTPEHSEQWLKDLFAGRHADRFRYVAAAGEWRAWSGTSWRPDQTLLAEHLVAEICREAAVACDNDARARQLASHRMASAVERFARADRRLAATIDQWDADPWILNTPACVVDLRTGERRSHDPAMFATRITGASPEGECPTWRAFLARITRGDEDMQAFLQRMAGYCLTGSTEEHALFFAFGTGANGKSTFVNALAAAMGEYATTAAPGTFTASVGEQHPANLAMLAGARMVSVAELDQGRAWAEARIKAVTGGDPITARYMRQDFFTFRPAFKIVVAANHKPQLHTVDEAIRRRLHLIPFEATIPPDERDPHLPDRLRAELGGILAWAVEGCLLWQRQGLCPPAAVSAASSDYMASEDTLGEWLGECCVQGVSEFGLVGSLFSAWAAWCLQARENPGNKKAFVQQLAARGFKSRRQGGSGARGIEGIALRSLVEPFKSAPITVNE